MTISASTIARTVVLALALVNQILTSFGIQTIPIEDETISTLISTAFLVVTTLVNWWKNNSFSKAAIASVTTSIKNGKNIVVIKDSYANSFIPFLTNHFEEIHIIDLRFYNSNINNYLNENNLKDILFFYNVKNFSEENHLIFINKLEED